MQASFSFVSIYILSQPFFLFNILFDVFPGVMNRLLLCSLRATIQINLSQLSLFNNLGRKTAVCIRDGLRRRPFSYMEMHDSVMPNDSDIVPSVINAFLIRRHPGLSFFISEIVLLG